MARAELRPGKASSAGGAANKPALYEPLDYVLVRAPLLPVEEYLALGAPADVGEQPTRPPLPERASHLLRSGAVRSAIRIASGSLAAALTRFEQERLNSRDAERLRAGLLRYLIRMSTRPTPFGLFAGVAVGRWAAATDLAVNGVSRPSLRPDMAWLFAFAQAQESRPEVRRHLRLVANPATVFRAGRVHLAERTPLQESAEPEGASIRATGVVRRAIALAHQPLYYTELADSLLAGSPGATTAKVERLLDELIASSFLLTDLRPPLTSSSPAQYIVARLAAIPETRPEAARLAELLEAAAAWETLPPAEHAEAYDRLVSQATALSEFTSKNRDPFQVDVGLDLSGSGINLAVGQEAARAAELLLRLSPLPTGLSYLSAYREAFVRRYGFEREVPLLELLDPLAGLGPPDFNAAAPAASAPTRRTQALLALAVEAAQERRQVVELDKATLEQLATWQPDPAQAPFSLDLYIAVAASSPADLDAGRFQIVVGPNLGASQAGRNLGRFAAMLGPVGAAALRDLAQAEEAQTPQALWAELVYLPRQHRAANVAVRPAIRAYEIPLGVSLGGAESRAVPLAELVIGVRDGRFVVRWPRAGREVLIAAGHMLNTLNAPALVRFLSDVTRDGRAHLAGFDWGPAASLPVLPRVQSGRAVLRPAEWRLDTARLNTDPARFPGELERWRERWRIPRHVYLGNNDNRLLLDLADQWQIEELRHELRKPGSAQRLALAEVLPGLDQTWTPGQGGHYASEFVVSLALRPAPPPVKQPHAEQARQALPRAAEAAGENARLAWQPVAPEIRLRPPGSEWLFAKLYVAAPLEEDLLAGPMREFAEEMCAKGLADSWFFIRYNDPDPHLRLRFQGAPERIRQKLLPALCDWAAQLMADEICLRFGLDTYDREVERFGGAAGLAAAETLFAADSRATSALIALEQQRSVPWDRISLAVLTTDDLLASLGLDVATRLEYLRANTGGRRDVGAAYRKRKGILRELLRQPGAVAADDADAVVAVLADRRRELRAVAEQLAELTATQSLTQPLARICGSFIHLHCNRLLGTDRESESLVRDLLVRTLEGLRQSGDLS